METYYNYELFVTSPEGEFFTTVTSYHTEDLKELAAEKLGLVAGEIEIEIVTVTRRDRL